MGSSVDRTITVVNANWNHRRPPLVGKSTLRFRTERFNRRASSRSGQRCVDGRHGRWRYNGDLPVADA
jgi:hypothetical protein